MRSLLYVPAHSDRFVLKAHERGADAIILDLEDSVPLEDKPYARGGLSVSVVSAGQRGAKVFVRVNDDPFTQNLDAIAACYAGAYGLVIPKAQDPKRLAELATKLDIIEQTLARPPMPFIAVVEDPGAVLDARTIARSPRVMALATGSEDLALSLGAQPTPDVLRLPKLLVHYAAKAEGLLSLGLLRSIADYSDQAAIASAAQEAKLHGFDGSSCVHPSAVPLLNIGFSPTETELDWAQRVVDAAATNTDVFTLDGRMVDAPVIARARAMLSGD